MDNRPTLSANPRPHPPLRAVSGGGLPFAKPQSHPSLPSRLSTVRSVSHPTKVVDLTSDAPAYGEKTCFSLLGEGDNIVSSPGVIDLSGEDEEPPAKRAKIASTDGRLEKERDGESQDIAHRTTPGSPLPTLPKANASQTRSILARLHRHGAESPLRKAHDLEPPAMATKLPPPKNVADFSPWTGHHPEDVLNEAVVKAGYCDKGGGSNQTECSSAKPSIWQNLNSKNNMGLQTLSWLFAQVMEKRQALGKCTAASSFKPPPRVTVTDTKREAWLRDLANPDIPLRKQSRTIPHGIRGKLLMDQCLGKEIPLQRAVWLAKCVGANELRAFRRKGVSGATAVTNEQKWVSDWTIQVEQFLEGVIELCGQPNWQPRITYAVRLATAFYAERLLDINHYLDWIVASFGESTPELLPIWIIMVQICWKEIVRFARRGRKLAEHILERMHIVNDGINEQYLPLKRRLQKLLAVLAVNNREYLVIPRSWTKYKYLLTSEGTYTPALDTAACMLAKRNERLAGPLLKTTANTRGKMLDLYDYLDAVDLAVDVDQMTSQCLAMEPDAFKVVLALLDWAATPFRHGHARVYIAARIIGKVRSGGVDTDSVILAYLSDLTERSGLHYDNLYQTVRELIRSDNFSVVQYLHWLISTGEMRSQDKSRPTVRLLTALPTGHLPIHLVNLRQTLLNKVCESTVQWTSANAVIAEIEQCFADVAKDFATCTSRLDTISYAERSVISEHIRARLPAIAKDFGISIRVFCMLRKTLEATADVDALSKLIDAAVSEADATLLAVLVDTTTMHVETLAALGYLERLYAALTGRYRTLRTLQPLERLSILALARLAKRMRGASEMAHMLASDLMACDQQSSNAVCSPASDSLISMHASSLDSDDDIDAVFASGNSMDDQLLKRVFARVVQRCIKGPVRMEHGVTGKFGIWFNQLRLVGGNGFEHLVAALCQSALQANDPDGAHLRAMMALVTNGCLALESVLTKAKQIDTPQAATTALLLLVSEYPCVGALSDVELFRYKVIQKLCYSEQSDLVSMVLGTACGDHAFPANNQRFADLLLAMSSKQSDVFQIVLERSSSSVTGRTNVVRLCQTALERSIPGDSSQWTLELASIIAMSNPLSIRVCSAALEAYSNNGLLENPQTRNELHKGLTDAIANGNNVWPQLVGAVNMSMKAALHQWANAKLLHLVSQSQSDDLSVDLAHRYLDVLDVTNQALGNEDKTSELVVLTEKLKDIEKRLLALSNNMPLTGSDMAIIETELVVLLHMCVLHTQPAATPTDDSKQALANTLVVLCSLLTHPLLQARQELAEYTVDLASVFADNLPESSLLTIARLMKITDARVQSIFGYSPAPRDAWLAAASQVQPAGSQQQRALARHASQHSLGNVRSGPTGQTPAGAPAQGQPQPQQRGWPHLGANKFPVEMKITPFALRSWEIMPDSTPVMGENDTSLSLGLFGSRKV